ncbi:heat shock protein Hsp20 [Chitinispirillum alkaliphilum]|nr:heat shock protein Hsp20 [Chitinispirillum alkaliphilum]
MRLPVLGRKNKERETVLDRIERPSSRFLDLFEEWQGIKEKIPLVDISETDRSFEVRAEIPGVEQDEIKLYSSGGVLTIEGEKKESREEGSKQKGTYYRESRYGSFRRDIPLGEDLQWEDAKANYKNGVLRVTVPKGERSQKEGKKIEIG